ncbi:hypothetical protein ACVW0P_000796 [Mucilaginibacter sp. UYNi724]
MVDNAIDCRNCSTLITDKFCPACGQPKTLKRVDAHYVSHEIQHLLHFEKGILFTIKELMIRPGLRVREYITHDRSRLVKPIVFIIITSLVYSTVNHFFHIEEGYVNYQGDKNSALTQIFTWVENHYGYANIIMGVFIAPWIKIFFRKQQYNFFEILILLCFVMGMGMLIYSVFTIASGLLKVSLMKVAGAVGIIYCSWAIAQFFNAKKVSGYIKSIAAYLLGVLSFTIAAMVLGALIDAFVRH